MKTMLDGLCRLSVKAGAADIKRPRMMLRILSRVRSRDPKTISDIRELYSPPLVDRLLADVDRFFAEPSPLDTECDSAEYRGGFCIFPKNCTSEADRWTLLSWNAPATMGCASAAVPAT